jgi:hypothetical protein
MKGFDAPIYSCVSVSVGVVALGSVALVGRVTGPQLDRQAGAQLGMSAQKLATLALNASSKISAEPGPTNGALAAARSATDEALPKAEAGLKTGQDFSLAQSVADSLATAGCSAECSPDRGSL